MTLNFKDGTTATCDVLIAADGIKSAVRAQMLRAAAETDNNPTLHRLIHPRWSGSVAYRSLIDADEVRKQYPDHPVLRISQLASAYLLLQA